MSIEKQTNKNIHVVIAGIILSNSKILLAQRGKGFFQGMWEFPGGKLEIGETDQQCLCRELMEELGIQAVIGDVFAINRHFYSEIGIEIELKTYLVNRFEGTPNVGADHSKIEWIDIPKLREMNLLPADIPIAEAIEEKFLR